MFDKDGNFDVHGAFEELKINPLLNHDENVIDAVIANEPPSMTMATTPQPPPPTALSGPDLQQSEISKAAVRVTVVARFIRGSRRITESNHQTQARKQGDVRGRIFKKITPVSSHPAQVERGAITLLGRQ